MSASTLLAMADAAPDRLAIVGPGDRLTYGALAARVRARREDLEASSGADARAGRARPLTVTASVESMVELLAHWAAGWVPAPLNARLTPAEVSAAKEELADANLPAGASVVLWTSGTSGRARGVALSWSNLEQSARAAAQRLDLSADDVWVASLSPAHVGGLALVTRSLLLGGTLVVPASTDIDALGELIDAGPWHDVRPTHLSVVPTQLLRLLDSRGERAAPEALRCVLVGGAHAPATLVDRALAGGWPIALTYGATEMTSQIATAPPELVRAVPGTVGEPLAGVEVRIESGEVWARGPTRALAYVGRGAPAIADADGWYRTGDLGHLDDRGRLRITGRRIDRIVSGGVTVDAVEVEEALRAHPTVIDVCVVGVPDEEWGERVGAWVEPVVGELELEELERHARERLAPAKRPRLWRTDGALPRNANGKVDRAAVRAALAAGSTSG